MLEGDLERKNDLFRGGILEDSKMEIFDQNPEWSRGVNHVEISTMDILGSSFWGIAISPVWPEQGV